MDVRRLTVLREVAERGSFSAAALALGYTQSAISHQVAALEREVGMTLVDRGARPVRLTAAGAALHRRAQAIAGEVAAAEAEMRALAGLEAGTVRIAAFTSACLALVPNAVGAFVRAHPGVSLRVSQLEPPEAREALLAGDLDLAVTYDFAQRPVADDERVERAHLVDDGYVVVVPSGHPLAARPALRMEELRDEAWHLPPSGRFRETMLELCRAAGFEPRAPFDTDHVYLAQGFVAAGLGVAMVPRLALLSPRAGMAVVELEAAPAARRVWAERRAGHRLPAVDLMVSMLRGAL